MLRDPAGVDPARYGAALGGLIGRFMYPGEPPEALMRSQMNSGAEVYQRMHGSSWFTPDGEWSTWDAVPRLPSLRIPTLIVGGTNDQCVPELAEQLQAGVPDSELAILDAAHLPFLEVPDAFFAAVRAFLHRVDEDVRAVPEAV